MLDWLRCRVAVALSAPVHSCTRAVAASWHYFNAHIIARRVFYTKRQLDESLLLGTGTSIGTGDWPERWNVSSSAYSKCHHGRTHSWPAVTACSL